MSNYSLTIATIKIFKTYNWSRRPLTTSFPLKLTRENLGMNSQHRPTPITTTSATTAINKVVVGLEWQSELESSVMVVALKAQIQMKF